MSALWRGGKRNGVRRGERQPRGGPILGAAALDGSERLQPAAVPFEGVEPLYAAVRWESGRAFYVCSRIFSHPQKGEFRQSTTSGRPIPTHGPRPPLTSYRMIPNPNARHARW